MSYSPNSVQSGRTRINKVVDGKKNRKYHRENVVSKTSVSISQGRRTAERIAIAAGTMEVISRLGYKNKTRKFLSAIK